MDVIGTGKPLALLTRFALRMSVLIRGFYCILKQMKFYQIVLARLETAFVEGLRPLALSAGLEWDNPPWWLMLLLFTSINRNPFSAIFEACSK